MHVCVCVFVCVCVHTRTCIYMQLHTIRITTEYMDETHNWTEKHMAVHH